MSFAVKMQQAVKDLFTCQQVADALAGYENDPAVDQLVQSWKGMLSAELDETGQVFMR